MEGIRACFANLIYSKSQQSLSQGSTSESSSEDRHILHWPVGSRSRSCSESSRPLLESCSSATPAHAKRDKRAPDAPPSYWKRMRGNSEPCPRLRLFENDVAGLNPDALIAIKTRSVESYFQYFYGCTPQQYRSWMTVRLTANYTALRTDTLANFSDLLKAEPSVALRVLYYMTAPPYRTRAEEDCAREIWRQEVIPSLELFAEKHSCFDLSDASMRHLIEALAQAEKTFAIDSRVVGGIAGIKRKFFGG
jgi:hypothetical protein